MWRAGCRQGMPSRRLGAAPRAGAASGSPAPWPETPRRRLAEEDAGGPWAPVRSRLRPQQIDKLGVVEGLDSVLPWPLGVDPHRAAEIFDADLMVAAREEPGDAGKKELGEAVLQAVADLPGHEEARPKEADARDARGGDALLGSSFETKIKGARRRIGRGRGQERDVAHPRGPRAPGEGGGGVDVDPPHFLLRQLPRLADAHRAERDLGAAGRLRGLSFDRARLAHIDDALPQLVLPGEAVEHLDRAPGQSRDFRAPRRGEEVAHESRADGARGSNDDGPIGVHARILPRRQNRWDTLCQWLICGSIPISGRCSRPASPGSSGGASLSKGSGRPPWPWW